ncbi:histone deacetylase HDT1 isoform X2 [Sesamum indicum]|uniref:Histone deacetylase HDT1 isoform X2 n=1 Tax=Sesamum indicum TaxID=4182 RepID=A0A6I9TY48_SESIN|nr:histone deacetylase HDT1 isoform X2 [Sesamum indicum]
MEFWGVEVKAGQPLKVQPEFGKLIHISQAALGEVKDVKGAKHVPLRLKVDSKNFIIGALSAEDRAQLMFDLVFERDFELSHDWKNGSVYFMGYVADDPVSDGEEFSDDFEDESEDEPVDALENGKVKPKSGDVKAAKVAAAKIGNKEEDQSDSDDDEDDIGSDSDDEMALDGEDSSDVSGEEDEDDEDDSSEEELPKKSKKRAAEQETPVPAKKAKSSTPDKSGNKKGQAGTPFPSKPAGKTPTGNKSKEQTPKSGGQLSCKSCSKSFTSENALQSHAKAKHGGK